MIDTFQQDMPMEITFNGAPMNLIGKTIKVGDWAPEFTAIKNDMSKFISKETKGKIVVYSIVPSIDTKVCTQQARYFNEKAEKFGKDVIVITVSTDLPFSQQRFCATEGIDNSLVISDYNFHEFGEKYGFLIDELKLLSRGIVVVDRDEIVRYVEYVSEVTNEVNYEKALEAINLILLD